MGGSPPPLRLPPKWDDPEQVIKSSSLSVKGRFRWTGTVPSVVLLVHYGSWSGEENLYKTNFYQGGRMKIPAIFFGDFS
jgi:hypothetical protein